MTPGELEDRLQEWGGYYREAREPAENRSLTGDSALSRFGKPPKRKGVRVGRHGLARRRLMAQAVCGYKIIPVWAVDPASGSQTRVYRAPVHHDPRETPAIQLVQDAWLSLHRVNAIQANVLRCQYQVREDREGRAKAAGVGKRAYSDHLKAARIWMHAKLSR